MKFFVLSLLISLNCYADLSTAQKLVNFFKAKANSVAVKINAHAKDYKIQKIYSANTFELNSISDIKPQTVVLEVWDYKINAQILLVSPQGSNEFFEIKDLSYIRSNEHSALQHAIGSLYAEESGQLKKIGLSLYKELDSLRLILGESKTSMQLDRLSPVVESQLLEGLSSKVERSSWNGLRIEGAVKINGRSYFKLDSITRESRLLTLSAEGTLVESNLVSWMNSSFGTTYLEDGKVIFHERDSKSDNADYSIEKLSKPEIAKALEFKTFDFKNLIETKVAERSFTPDYYITTGSGRDLFISEIKLRETRVDSDKSAMFKDIGMSAKVVVKAAVLDSVIEATYEGTKDYSQDGVFLSIYSGKDVLKIDVSDRYNPKIVRNDWKVKAVGRVFDKNFAKVAESFEKISRKLGAKVMSCKKMMESIN